MNAGRLSFAKKNPCYRRPTTGRRPTRGINSTWFKRFFQVGLERLPALEADKGPEIHLKRFSPELDLSKVWHQNTSVHLVGKWIAHPHVLNHLFQAPTQNIKYILLRLGKLQLFRCKKWVFLGHILKTTCIKISFAEQQLWLGRPSAALTQNAATESTYDQTYSHHTREGMIFSQRFF